ncbi:NAD(P)-dependent oxidoreductase [Streptomyces sp. MUM 203J]|uniref:NAD-dependent epimerase/dehydratase family protein n=1 Tax=Streptomyces sp. MUM 203J TaxID=2791990 RepID=UPI001F03BDF4|nr:NAD(P)-dependent oxidoreductase [Streptomyces sp. MUM 203J]MCH0538619.1 NAD(P)-dependent oxidoreductase [Streptomyces sp. MUM 203J]
MISQRIRMLVTGGTGFVGSHVVDRLAEAPGVEVRLLTHRRELPPHWAERAVEAVRGDLTDPGSLRGICDGVDTVLHLAAHIGGDEESCRAVNTEGTRALLAQARRAGVRRVVQLGTAAVYRDEPHRGEPEGVPAEDPVSPTSVTRLAGERLVLAAGGTVLRPHLVYGRGDTWVVPALARMLRAVPHWVDGGRARISMISADALAGALTDLALGAAPEGWRGGVLHASHPEPVTARELVTAVGGVLGLALPSGETTRERAAELLAAAGVPGSARVVSLMTTDHWYDSGRLWSMVPSSPGPAFPEAFGTYAGWYGERYGAGVFSSSGT